MGRKIEMKKIQDNTKCQVTFSKRRTSLTRKAEAISVSCDVDVALLAFSPSGRISKFCNRERMEDFFDRYVNLPVEKRLSQIKNMQGKMDKLQGLGNIRNEGGKLHYLNDQIQNLELQIKKNQIDMQLAEANLRDFELSPEQEASLHQLSWCERNLQQSIERLKEIRKGKMVMEHEGAMPWSYNHGENSLHFAGSSTSDGQLHMQFGSWRYPESIFDEMLGKGKGKEMADAYGDSETIMQNNNFNASIPTSYGMRQFGVPETLAGPSYTSLQNNIYNAQIPSSYAMNQLEIALPAKTPNEFTYASSQQDYQLWKQAPMTWHQAESNSSFRYIAGESSNFTQNYSNSNNVINTSADASNCWKMPMLQNQPNVALNNIDIDANEEGNESNNNKKEHDDAYTDMIISPPPSVQAPPWTSGVSNDLYDFFLSEDPSEETQKIQDTYMWDWGNLKF